MSNHTVSDEVFNELQRVASAIWSDYDDTYGYASEKIVQVSRLTNFKDNFGTIIGMFDNDNQRKLYETVGDDAKQAIKSWVVSDFYTPDYIQEDGNE